MRHPGFRSSEQNKNFHLVYKSGNVRTVIWEVAMSDPRAKFCFYSNPPMSAEERHEQNRIYPDMAVLADKRIVLAEEKRLLDTAQRHGGSVEARNILAAKVHLIETDIREILAMGRIPR
jgi:hypothetical protein